MTGVMDLKHILCESMEVKPTKPTILMHPLEYYDDIQPNPQRHYHHESTADHLNHTRLNNNNATATTTSPMCRQRVHSEHYRTSPVLSWGYHYSHHHLHLYYHRDEVLIPPLTSSLSTNMIPSHSSSSSIYSITTPSMTSSLSPSTSSSASSLSSSSSSTLSSPITPTIPTPPIHDRHQQQRRRHRSASTSQVHHHHHQAQRPIPADSSSTAPLGNQIQTRTPWTPLEDDLLQKGYEQGLSWAMISSTYLPHRSRGCCWGRFKTLQNKNLIDVKVQQQLRSAKLAWKTMELSKSTSSTLSSPRSSLSL